MKRNQLKYLCIMCDMLDDFIYDRGISRLDYYSNSYKQLAIDNKVHRLIYVTHKFINAKYVERYTHEA